MTRDYPIDLSRIAYDAASQTFQAMAVVHEPDGAIRIAVSVPGPITLDFSQAAARLSRKARELHRSGMGLRSIAAPATPTLFAA